jgi:hypothetical protein
VRKLEERARLVRAEAELSEVVLAEARDVTRPRKCPERRALAHRDPAPLRQPIQQDDTDRETQLLARDTVDDGLEHRRKPRRLHAAEVSSQRAEVGIRSRHPVEGRELHSKAERALEEGHGCLDRGVLDDAAAHVDLERRMSRRARLCRSDLHRVAANHDRSAIRVAVPEVDGVVRAAT